MLRLHEEIADTKGFKGTLPPQIGRGCDDRSDPIG
jgi:hypothetical protein